MLLWDYKPQYVPQYVDVWLDASDEQRCPAVYLPTETELEVFWYDDGKKEYPLLDADSELPTEVKFEPLKGEQTSIFDEPEQEVEMPCETYDDEPLDVAEMKEEKEFTLKDIFNELYKYAIHLPKKERNEYYRDNLLPFFSDEESMNGFIQSNIERKKRNLILRRIRMVRKANLADFNYFCTFTYSDELHTEETFKKKLKAAFRNLCFRKQWKYMGVWERSPEKQRLHFHGLFQIPEGQMVGEIKEVRDYSVRLNRVQVSHQNSYFNERFGRSDFESIVKEKDLYEAVAYIMKYMEKTGEKVVYSKGLPQYFITDVAEDDVATRMGLDDRKLLLFDDFACYNNRQYVGKVSKQTIDKLPKAN